MRVMLVDDDPSILSAFRRMLGRRPGWDLVLATSAEEALILASGPELDVVVTDMQMPGTDGAELLSRFKDRYPAVARIVLSGHSDRRSSIRSATVAHQFLTKPCDASVLTAAVERSFALQQRLSSPELRAAVGRIGSLPSPPAILTELTRLLDDDNSGAADVVAVVRSDVSVAAKLLQLVNSAFFGLPRRIDDVQEAIVYLGLDVVRDLAVCEGTLSATQNASGLPSRVVERIRAHSENVSAVARDLTQGTSAADGAIVAGLLHDVGRLVLGADLGPHQPPGRRRSSALNVSADEGDSGGVDNHAEVGAYLLALWGLPSSVIEAVARHHDDLTSHDHWDLASAVAIADRLVIAAEDPCCESDGPTERAIDEKVTDRLAITERVTLIRRQLTTVTP